MIENVKDEILKRKKRKVLDFVPKLDGSWRAKNSPKLSSKYLIDRICKFQQYMNI